MLIEWLKKPCLFLFVKYFYCYCLWSQSASTKTTLSKFLQKHESLYHLKNLSFRKRIFTPLRQRFPSKALQFFGDTFLNPPWGQDHHWSIVVRLESESSEVQFQPQSIALSALAGIKLVSFIDRIQQHSSCIMIRTKKNRDTHTYKYCLQPYLTRLQLKVKPWLLYPPSSSLARSAFSFEGKDTWESLKRFWRPLKPRRTHFILGVSCPCLGSMLWY